MDKLVIYNSGIYNFEKQEMHKGGVLTYIKDLAKLGKEIGVPVFMYQYENDSPKERSYDWDGIIIRDVYINDRGHKLIQHAFEEVYRRENCNGAVFVIATDQMDVKIKFFNVIQIQHGIAFDIPADWIPSSLLTAIISKTGNKLLRCIKNVRRLDNVPHTVCVDYNYYNWYRTIGTETTNHRMVVIPNYTSNKLSLEDFNKKNEARGKVKKIVFARRMVEHRGSLMFARVAKRILEERSEVDFTFSGDGPCLSQMQDMLNGFENVHFTEYKSEDSVSFHMQYDICVVPTIYSEGTSLSLLEGMAAGCIPICTHVGGLTNIILDGYNGFLCHPDEESMYSTMIRALETDDISLRLIAQRAYDIATTTFSINRWKKQWLDVFNSI